MHPILKIILVHLIGKGLLIALFLSGIDFLSEVEIDWSQNFIVGFVIATFFATEQYLKYKKEKKKS